MSYVSYSEDIQDRRIDNQIFSAFKEFRDRQIDEMRLGRLDEARLKRELEVLQKRIVEPLDNIRSKIGEEGVKIGAELLKLQNQISIASKALASTLDEVNSDCHWKSNGDVTLHEFLESFSQNYRLLLDVIDVLAQPLEIGKDGTIKSIKRSSEQDLSAIKSLAKTLTAREIAIAELYRENEDLKAQLDSLQQLETTGLDASGYDDFDKYTSDKGIRRTRK